MSFRNWGGFWRLCSALGAAFPSSLLLAAVAMALLPVVSQAQTQSGAEFKLDTLSAQPAPLLPIQSPTIVTTPPQTATDKIFTPSPAPEASQEQKVAPPKPAPLERNEFQEFVLKSIGRDLPMFGYNLFEGGPSTFAPLDRVPVPSDYVIGPGDEIMVRAWGQIDVDVRTTVDRNGRIYIPKVGSISVATTRYQDLDARVRSSVARIFKNFDLVVTLGDLRSVQIFVVGQAKRPGSYTVSSLSTLVNALFASGGPTTKGSMRRVQLKRANKIITEFDVYDLLQKGDKSKDVQLLPGDVVFIPPIGQLAAISGSVNVPAIYELKDKQTLDDLIAMAGGLTTTASGQKVLIERIQNRETRTVDEFMLDKVGLAKPVRDGDLVRVQPLSPRFENAVTLQGNVASPARYPWHEGMHITDLLRDNNDLITNAFYDRQNRGGVTAKPKEREVNWDFAVIQRLEKTTLTTHLYPFNLGKAILGDPKEDLVLRPGDIVAVYSAVEPLPKTEADVVLSGSILGVPPRRFAWREGMKVTDMIPDGQWLVDYYGYWYNLKGDGLRSEINWDFANIVRLNPADLTKTTIPFNLGKAVLEKDASQNLTLQPGDEIFIFTKDELAANEDKRAKYVRLEGEFGNSGVYRVLPRETLRQLVMRVGGVTNNAYIYGAEFTRESTRVEQQKKLSDTLDRLEAEAARAATARSQSAISKEEADILAQETQAQKALIAKLRQIKATGRIVLELPRSGATIKNIPDLVLEDGDRLVIPPRPSTVSVFGAVYNQNAFIYKDGKRIGDYLEQAGGPTKDADKGSLYLVKADGTVVSKQQSGWFFNSFDSQKVLPGDAIVVPEELIKFSWTRELKDWSQIFYQFALGAAALKVIKDL
jgi:polysaccharide export outer membrane protein